MSKILLIEDEVILRETLAEILEINGFEVLSAESGEKALIALQTWEPDLIVSDILMVGMSGFEFIKHIKQNALLAKKPFIFLSALAGEEDRLHAAELGATEFITKPFKSKAVIAAILKHLNVTQ